MAEVNRPLETVRGTLDLSGGEMHAHQHLQDRLLETFRLAGYLPVSVPVLEQAELYLRKSGADIISKMYTFEDFGGRQLALRPEFTASIVRYYLAHDRTAPLPLRYAYTGPAFRYEKPQRGRYRQFTMTGVELIGCDGPAADAEVIALACWGLERLGVKLYQLILGHIGILRALLTSLGLSPRLCHFLLESMEDVGRPGRGLAYVRRRLAEINPPRALQQTPAAWHALTAELAQTVLQSASAETNVHATGNRTTEAILHGLLRRHREEDDEKIERAFAFIAELHGLSGSPAEVLQGAAGLLGRYGLSEDPLIQLREVLAALQACGVDASRLRLQLALGRGLQYYTDVVFEIYAPQPWSQLCGGGRYNELVQALGGRQPVPAMGFAYGIERLQLALEAEGHTLPAPPPPVVLVAAAQRAVLHRALAVAQHLRAREISAVADVRERSARANLDYAHRSGIPYVLFVDEEASPLALHRLADGERFAGSLAEVEQVLRG